MDLVAIHIFLHLLALLGDTADYSTSNFLQAQSAQGQRTTKDTEHEQQLLPM